jgi:hypothetical protein
VSAVIEVPTTHEPVPDLLIPKEAAGWLRESVKTTYRRADPKDKLYDPSFPVVRKPGGGLLIPRLALEKWAKNHGQGIPGPLRITVIPGTCAASSTHDPDSALNAAGPAS